MGLNLFPFVVEALGSNKTIHKDIDNLYQRYKYEFYKAAKESEWYEHPIFKEGSLLQEEYCKKVLGILTADIDDDMVYQDFMKLIQKGFRWTYEYVNKRFSVDVDEYTRAFTKKYHGATDDKGIGIEQHFCILLFLALNMQKKVIENEVHQRFVSLLYTRLQHSEGDEKIRMSYDGLKPEDIKRVQKLKQELFKKYGGIRNFDELLDKHFDGSKRDMYTFLFDFEHLSSVSIFQDVKFTERDIDEILCLYTIVREDVELDVDDALQFLIPGLYIKYLLKAYKQVKEMYFRNNKEIMFIELEGTEKELQRTKEKLKSTQRSLLEAEKIHGLLEKENLRLKAELAEAQRNREELNSLREFLFSLDRQEEYPDEDIDFEKLKQFKAVVIGGHERWQQRMKEYLPNFIFIHPDQLNFDIRLLDGIDIVFVCPNYLNHSMYYKLMAAIEGKDIKIVYINQQNENIALKFIYKTIIE